MNARAYARFELNFFNKKFNTKVAFKAVPKKKINTLFAVLGQSVLGKTVPLVLSTALGLRPRAQFFPIRTDQERQICLLYIYRTVLKTGQNLARQWGTLDNPDDRVKSWYQERQYYSYSKFTSPMGASCSKEPCGHYTQVF